MFRPLPGSKHQQIDSYVWDPLLEDVEGVESFRGLDLLSVDGVLEDICRARFVKKYSNLGIDSI